MTSGHRWQIHSILCMTTICPSLTKTALVYSCCSHINTFTIKITLVLNINCKNKLIHVEDVNDEPSLYICKASSDNDNNFYSYKSKRRTKTFFLRYAIPTCCVVATRMISWVRLLESNLRIYPDEFSEIEHIYGTNTIISEHYHIQEALLVPSLVICPLQRQPLPWLLPLQHSFTGFWTLCKLIPTVYYCICLCLTSFV